MRRHQLIVMILLTGLSAGLLCGSRSMAEAVDDVPMFRGNAAHTGEMPGPGPDPTTGISKQWYVQTGAPTSASPAVVGGVVYVGTQSKYQSNLYAISADDGRVIWEKSLGTPIYASPSVVDGMVFVGTVDDESLFGDLYAFGTITGDERWRFTTKTDLGFFSSPTVVDGILLIDSYDSKHFRARRVDRRGALADRHRGTNIFVTRGC